jgi:phage shock protein PspC (stress-responsive transcriptional regulator)
MKKTLTVNLGGIVFHIDEDAYHLLDNYLANLRAHFSREEGTDEIMNDFETRISELLNDRIRLGFQVITIEHIEEVITRMGKPEQIFQEDSEEKDEKRSTTGNTEYTGKTKKRLMRDPDDRIISGVASGLALYLGCDVVVIRLILIALLFFGFPFVVAFYLILWLVVPVASTAADRLLMRGERVNLENIGKTVTDGFEKGINDVNAYIRSEKSRTALQKVGDFIVSLFGVLLKIVAVFAGIILLPVLLLVVFILIVVIFALFAGGIGVVFSGVPFLADNINWVSGVPEYVTLLGSIGGILLLGIPIIALLYSLFGSLLKLKPVPAAVKWGLIVTWLIALALCIISWSAIGNSIGGFHHWPTHWHWRGW